MSRLGFTYNMNTCLGCAACQLACKSVNALNPGEFYRKVSMTEVGPYSGSCNHCKDAACVKACPTGAMYKASDGTTRHDDGICIACGACMWNCPYGAISFSTTKGVSQKCTSCADRRDKGLLPACVQACPSKSLRFGIIEGETSADLPFLPDQSITDPSVKVIPSARAIKLMEKGGQSE